MSSTTTIPGLKKFDSICDLREESQFWMKAVRSWRTVIQRLVEKAGEIKASPEVTANVAKTAGDLSLLADRLVYLSQEIERHDADVHRLCEQSEDDQGECRARHKTIYNTMRVESEQFRTLVRAMLQLDGVAYRRFLS